MKCPICGHREKSSLVFKILLGILLVLVSIQLGFILGKWEYTDRDGKLAKHETQIEVLKSDIKVIKEKFRIP